MVESTVKAEKGAPEVDGAVVGGEAPSSLTI